MSLSWLSLLRFIPKNINYPDDSDDSDELDQNSNGNHLNIIVFSIDALSISPETSFQSEWLNVEKGIRSNLVKNSLIPKVDVVLMNPPFSMGRSMDSGLKQSLFDKMTEYGLEKYIDKNMGLHGYFILHSDRFLNSGGKMSLIIPASTFDSDYSSSLIRFLKDQDYHIEYLIEILSESSAFSYNCTFKELIIIGIKGKLANNSKTKVVSIKREINEFEIEKVIDSIHNNMNDEFINIKEIQTNELYEEMNWVRVFKESSDLLDKLYETDRFIRLKDDPSIEVIRGFDGTYLEYVCLPNKRWRINELISKTGFHPLIQ